MRDPALTYPTVDVACFCGSTEREDVRSVDRYGFRYPLHLCVRCGLIYQSPRLTEEGAAEFYSSGHYREIYGDHGLPPFLGRDGQTFVEFLDSLQIKPTRVLEVGAGEQPFWDGSDRVDLDARFGGLEIPGVGYDLAVMHHVLEHLGDLESELDRVRAVMSPEGFLYIGVPGLLLGQNDDRWQSAHNYEFVADTLAYVMECCGWSEWYCDEAITSLWKPSETRRPREAVPGKATDVVRSILSSRETGRIQLPSLRAVNKFDLELRRDRCRKILAMRPPDAGELCGAEAGKQAIILAAGPSIDDRIETIREMAARDDTAIIAIDRMVGWCNKHEIHPDYIVALDASPDVLESLGQVQNGARRIVGIQSPPEAFRLAPDNTWVLQWIQAGVELGCLWDEFGYDKVTVCNVGGSVALSSISVAMMLGSRRIAMFGFDCKPSADGKFYADGTSGAGCIGEMINVEIDGEMHVTTPALMSFAQQFFILLSLAKSSNQMDEIKVYGPSLVRAMVVEEPIHGD